MVNFLIAYILCEEANGTLRLRIDDLDSPRIRREYIDDIFEKIDLLGIQPSEGPSNTDDHIQNFSQQDRIGKYNLAIGKLEEKGLLYACRCSRSQFSAISKEGHRTCGCREIDLPLDTPECALRLRLETGEVRIPEWCERDIVVNLREQITDPVLRRRDGLPSYQIASLVDDVDHGIDFIVRGQDLLSSTAIQLVIADLIGFDEFKKTVFFHHALIAHKDGTKLSKSTGGSKPLPVNREFLLQKAMELIETVKV